MTTLSLSSLCRSSVLARPWTEVAGLDQPLELALGWLAWSLLHNDDVVIVVTVDNDDVVTVVIVDIYNDDNVIVVIVDNVGLDAKPMSGF